MMSPALKTIRSRRFALFFASAGKGISVICGFRLPNLFIMDRMRISYKDIAGPLFGHVR
jgi:hypothetical protein